MAKTTVQEVAFIRWSAILALVSAFASLVFAIFLDQLTIVIACGIIALTSAVLSVVDVVDRHEA